jgi:hypothetical protein
LSLFFDGGPAAECPIVGAIMGSASLRVSFDAIAEDDLVGAGADEDAERWRAMEVAGRGRVSSHFNGAGAREEVGRVAGIACVDCDDCGRELPAISILRYFFIVGESGAAKLYLRLSGKAPSNINHHAYLSTLAGSKILYASNTFLLTLRTSALASVAVSLIASSISLARASLSRSGGLKHCTHERRLSIAIKRRVMDFSRRARTK